MVVIGGKRIARVELAGFHGFQPGRLFAQLQDRHLARIDLEMIERVARRNIRRCAKAVDADAFALELVRLT